MIKVLSIGAGAEQVFSIQEAKKRGLFVVAVDGNNNACGFEYADVFHVIDLKNVDEIIHIAKEHEIAFILPSPIGRFLTTVGAVNDALNLPGVSEQAAKIFTDKKQYFDLLHKHGLFLPKQTYIPPSERSIERITQEIHSIGLPCMLKTNNGSGSRGVIAIHHKEEMNESVLFHLQSVFDTEGTLIESFIDGKEYGLDGRILDGEFELLLLREKIMSDLPYRQEIGYISPVNVDKEVIEQISSNIQSIINDLQIDNCLFNADVIIHNDYTFIIEASARPAGLKLMEEFIPRLTGVNPVPNLIDVFLGGAKKQRSRVEHKCIGMYFFDLPEGKLGRVPNSSELKHHPNMLFYNCNLIEGSEIGIVREGKDILSRGFFLIESSDLAELKKIKEEVYSMFIIS